VFIRICIGKCDSVIHPGPMNGEVPPQSLVVKRADDGGAATAMVDARAAALVRINILSGSTAVGIISVGLQGKCVNEEYVAEEAAQEGETSAP